MTDKIRADLLVINANQMCTLRGPKRPRVREELRHLGTVPKAAVAMASGKIVAVGSTEELKNKVDRRFVEILDASGMTVLPGFVDPHTHALFYGSREDEFAMKVQGATYMEILRDGGGIQRTMVATRNATKQQLTSTLRQRLSNMLRYGTTTVEVKSGYGLNTKDELKMLEVIKEVDRKHPVTVVPTFLGAHIVPPEFRGRADDYVALMIDDMLPKIEERKLAKYCDVFCEKDVFDTVQSKRLLAKAKEHGLAPKMHIDEIEDIGGVGIAVDVGATSVDHLIVTSAPNMKCLADKGILGVLLPGTPYVMMDDKHPNARALIEHGVPVALGTDMSPNCWTESMQMVSSLACTQLRMTPEEVITASTINAAYAIGLGDKVGSIEVGKQGDLVLMDGPNYMHLPYRFGTNLVKLVIKAGKVLVDRRPEYEER
jgi:imidazolonepropionase